jgi:drug/metabolite transporter (DMT)-like permease
MPSPSKSLVIAAFVAIYLIWGSTYLAILIAIKTMPPMLMAGGRFVIAGLILLIWAFLRGERLPDARSIGKIAFSGFMLLFIGNGAVTWTEQYLPSGLVAILVATVPLWFVLLDTRQWTFHFSNRSIIVGLCIGFAGVILLFAGKNTAAIFHDRSKFISLLMLVCSTICWTIGSLFSKYRKMQGSTLMKVALQMLVAGILFFILAFTLYEQDGLRLSGITWASVAALAYLIVMGSIIAYLAYMWLLSVRPASLVGTYAYVNPVVAVFLGWLLAHESISIQQAIGLGVIILGLVVVNRSKERKLPAPVEAGVQANPLILSSEKE